MAPYSQGLWQEDEHQRFLDALKLYPQGPWADIAQFVGTRSPRQVQTHAQKYYEKIERHLRGLQRDRRGGVRARSTGERIRAIGLTREHEIDQEILEACSRAMELGERLPTPAKPRKADSSRAASREEFIEGSGWSTVDPRGSVEDDGNDDLLPLDKSLDFLIEVLAGLDDQSNQLATLDGGEADARLSYL